MMKIIRHISISGDTAIIYYLNDQVNPRKGTSRQIRKMSKIVSLEKLQASGALDLDQMEEDLK